MSTPSKNRSTATNARRVAVTGAASGIGAATAKRLQSQGWQVACLDRNQLGARSTAGNDGIAIEVDVADEQSVVRAFQQIGSLWGGLDALVTAAGIINTRPLFETPVAEFRQLFDINVIGSFLCVREGAKYLQRGGRICMVASISSYTGGGYVARSAYATSKGAVLTLMKGCARELGPRGIAVNAVAPGFIDTPFVASAMSDPARRKEIEAAVGKVGTAEQIAECIAFLISPAAEFVHGETLIADGGILMR